MFLLCFLSAIKQNARPMLIILCKKKFYDTKHLGQNDCVIWVSFEYPNICFKTDKFEFIHNLQFNVCQSRLSGFLCLVYTNRLTYMYEKIVLTHMQKSLQQTPTMSVQAKLYVLILVRVSMYIHAFCVC